jgi:hypothetical protein
MLIKPKRYFLLSEYGSFLERALDAGICFSLFDHERMTGKERPFHFLKHDIHADLLNTIKMAELEATLKIPATYFMMHRHSLNQKFYDSAATWEALRLIQSLGHEVSVHVDGFVLIERYGDLKVGVREELRKFSDEGLRIRGGNTHGNSRYQKALNFEPMNFYREVINRSYYCTNEFWNSHYGRYSLQDLGFEYWADNAVWFAPDKYVVPDMYVSDNSTGWNILRTSTLTWFMIGIPYSLSAKYIGEIIAATKGATCNYLVHPQFYSNSPG